MSFRQVRLPRKSAFKVRAVAEGPGQLRVLAFHQGQSLGIITLAPTVQTAVDRAESRPRDHEQPLAPTSVRLPDLSLVILEGRQGGPAGPGPPAHVVGPETGVQLDVIGNKDFATFPVAAYGSELGGCAIQ